MVFKVYVNNVRADNITADTIMEAELDARIRYGLTAKIDITAEEA